MRCKFLSRDYGQRLHGSICRYDGKAVYVNTEDGGIRVKPHRGTYTTITPDDPLFDVSSVPLGYYNTTNGAYYVRRNPSRRYKQGVDNGNTLFSDLNERGVGGDVYSKGFFDMVNNTYPSLDDALKHVDKRGVALSRTTAISKNDMGIVNVYFKGALVGWCPPNKKKVIVPDTEKAKIVSMFLSDFNWEIE